MALKPKIYKATVSLSDMDRNHYEELQLTLAQHPSETLERMLVRLLVFCLNADPQLSFTRGLSTAEEPDLWQRSLDDQIEHWIEVGQPEPDRVKKGGNQSGRISVYSFGKSGDSWWQSHAEALRALPRLDVFQFAWDDVQQLTALVARSMNLSVTITEARLYVADDAQTVELPLSRLIAADA